MEYIEANPLPPICQECEEKAKRYFDADEATKITMEQEEDFYFDCGSCDHAGECWKLPRAEELRLQRKGKVKAIERLQREIAAIDAELEGLKYGEC